MAKLNIPRDLLISILIRLRSQTLIKFLCFSKSWYSLFHHLSLPYFSRSDSTMAELYIPTDILINILIRLPSKTLIKFLYVSKSWYSLITHPDFIISHFNHHQQIYDSRNPNYSISIPGYNSYSFWRLGKQLPNRIDLPVQNTSVVGSCNGLLCLKNEENQSLLHVWNPSIRKYINIDSVPIDTFSGEHCVLGFGFDSFSNDYKVVSIIYHVNPTDLRPRAQFYSINAGSWTNVALPDFFRRYNILFGGRLTICVKNVIHWIIYRTTSCEHASILTFDVRREEFGELKLPPELANKSSWLMSLAVIDNLLAALDGMIFKTEDKPFCVWVMKDYDVKAPWIVLYKIHTVTLSYNLNFGDMERDEVCILTSWGTSILFNAKDQSSSSIISARKACFFGVAFIHTENLALLDKRHQSQTEKMDVEKRFAHIKWRIWKKLQGWKEKLFSRPGKEVMVKAVA